jgi:death-on-curing protein
MKGIVFLEVEDVIEIQRMQIEAFGGDPGILDQNALEAACHAPRNILYYEDGDLADCAAALMWHVCADHAFVDGNKRAATVAGIVMLSTNGIFLPYDDETQEGLTALIFSVADHQASRQDVGDFLRKHIP